ncbi:MAG: dockerin type I domain-containing protein [Oscillospiraceae bacterium]|nr:dockerin type I domain-containing protein [Oscillospiraceae bacterium]
MKKRILSTIIAAAVIFSLAVGLPLWISASDGDIIKGDMNGDGFLSAIDALLILRITNGLVSATETDIARGDMNGDGRISAADALTVLELISWSTEIPSTYVQGDLDNDGVVDMSDVMLATYISADILPTSVFDVTVGDMNGDGLIDVLDALMILRLSEGVTSEEQIQNGFALSVKQMPSSFSDEFVVDIIASADGDIAAEFNLSSIGTFFYDIEGITYTIVSTSGNGKSVLVMLDAKEGDVLASLTFIATAEDFSVTVTGTGVSVGSGGTLGSNYPITINPWEWGGAWVENSFFEVGKSYTMEVDVLMDSGYNGGLRVRYANFDPAGILTCESDNADLDGAPEGVTGFKDFQIPANFLPDESRAGGTHTFTVDFTFEPFSNSEFTSNVIGVFGYWGSGDFVVSKLTIYDDAGIELASRSADVSDNKRSSIYIDTEEFRRFVKDRDSSGWLSQTGNPNYTVDEETGALKILDRVNGWDGIDVKLDGLKTGKRYNIEAAFLSDTPTVFAFEKPSSPWGRMIESDYRTFAILSYNFYLNDDGTATFYAFDTNTTSKHSTIRLDAYDDISSYSVAWIKIEEAHHYEADIVANQSSFTIGASELKTFYEIVPWPENELMMTSGSPVVSYRDGGLIMGGRVNNYDALDVKVGTLIPGKYILEADLASLDGSSMDFSIETGHLPYKMLTSKKGSDLTLSYAFEVKTIGGISMACIVADDTFSFQQRFRLQTTGEAENAKNDYIIKGIRVFLEDNDPEPDNGGGSGGGQDNNYNPPSRPSNRPTTNDSSTPTTIETQTGTAEIIIDVPKAVIEEIAGNLPVTQIAATAAGSQVITTSASNAGQNAVLLVFNEETGAFEVVSAATVNDEGLASLRIPGAGDYIVVVAQTGDLTGTGNVTAADALLLLKALTGEAELNPLQKFLTSSRGDSEFTATDALNILKLVVGA